jgi:hypothetical protein
MVEGRRLAVAVAAVATLVLVSSGSPGSAAPSAQPTSSSTAPAPVPTGQVKYYIVAPPVNGQQEYLFEIAARTLGNGNRYKEIFELNQGRRQADGGALTDPAVLHPGWVLLLPADASGPGVLTGPFPTAAPTPVITTSPPPLTVPAPTDPGSGSLLRLGVFGSIIVVALVLLRRGTRLTLFGHRTRRAATVGPPAPAMAGAPPSPIAVEPAEPSAPALWTPPVDPHRMVLEAEVTALSSNTAGSDTGATVRLAGSRLPQPSPAWLWLETGVAAPAPTYVPLGRGSQGILWVDLVQAPDVVTVIGDATASRRIGARMAEHLVSGAVPVTVVGSVLGQPVAGARVARTLAEAADATEDPSGPQIIVAVSGPDDHATIRRLIGRSTPRTVLVLVTEARRGRWSIQVG